MFSFLMKYDNTMHTLANKKNVSNASYIYSFGFLLNPILPPRCVLLLALVTALGGSWLLEQPKSSVMGEYFRFKWLCQVTKVLLLYWAVWSNMFQLLKACHCIHGKLHMVYIYIYIIHVDHMLGDGWKVTTSHLDYDSWETKIIYSSLHSPGNDKLQLL